MTSCNLKQKGEEKRDFLPIQKNPKKESISGTSTVIQYDKLE
jgi:hypothetical protein